MDKIENRTILAKNLIRLRKKNGLTQGDLAKLASVSRRTIAMYETKPAKPPLENIKRLAKALKVTIEELIGEEIKNEKATSIFSNIDSRTLKRFKQILLLSNQDRHLVYSFVESLLLKKDRKSA